MDFTDTILLQNSPSWDWGFLGKEQNLEKLYIFFL